MSDEGQNNDNKSDNDLSAAVAALLSKNSGDSFKTVEMLLKENYELRAERRELRGKVKELSPQEGTVIISGDKYALLESYEKIGKPDDLVKIQQERDDLQGELSKRDRRNTLSEAAIISGYKPSVLIDLVESRGLEIELRDIQENGETKKMAFIKGGDDKESISLGSYAESNFKDYLPALMSKDSSKGVEFPPQAPGKDHKPASVMKERIRNKYQTPREAAAKQ